MCPVRLGGSDMKAVSLQRWLSEVASSTTVSTKRLSLINRPYGLQDLGVPVRGPRRVRGQGDLGASAGVRAELEGQLVNDLDGGRAKVHLVGGVRPPMPQYPHVPT